MTKNIEELHEKIANVYNSMWAAYKKYLADGSAKHINDTAYSLEERYADDKTILQYIWYQKASWAGIVDQMQRIEVIRW